MSKLIFIVLTLILFAPPAYPDVRRRYDVSKKGYPRTMVIAVENKEVDPGLYSSDTVEELFIINLFRNGVKNIVSPEEQRSAMEKLGITAKDLKNPSAQIRLAARCKAKIIFLVTADETTQRGFSLKQEWVDAQTGKGTLSVHSIITNENLERRIGSHLSLLSYGKKLSPKPASDLFAPDRAKDSASGRSNEKSFLLLCTKAKDMKLDEKENDALKELVFEFEKSNKFQFVGSEKYPGVAAEMNFTPESLKDPAAVKRLCEETGSAAILVCEFSRICGIKVMDFTIYNGEKADPLPLYMVMGKKQSLFLKKMALQLSMQNRLYSFQPRKKTQRVKASVFPAIDEEMLRKSRETEPVEAARRLELIDKHLDLIFTRTGELLETDEGRNFLNFIARNWSSEYPEHRKLSEKIKARANRYAEIKMVHQLPDMLIEQSGLQVDGLIYMTVRQKDGRAVFKLDPKNGDIKCMGGSMPGSPEYSILDTYDGVFDTDGKYAVWGAYSKKERTISESARTGFLTVLDFASRKSRLIEDLPYPVPCSVSIMDGKIYVLLEEHSKSVRFALMSCNVDGSGRKMLFDNGREEKQNTFDSTAFQTAVVQSNPYAKKLLIFSDCGSWEFDPVSMESKAVDLKIARSNDKRLRKTPVRADDKIYFRNSTRYYDLKTREAKTIPESPVNSYLNNFMGRDTYPLTRGDWVLFPVCFRPGFLVNVKDPALSIPYNLGSSFSPMVFPVPGNEKSFYWIYGEIVTKMTFKDKAK